jgi:ribonucleotide reductase beta subunit family protein with ferritin-like domain
MNAEKMSDYIRFIADFYVEQLGAPKIWNISECPFEFMKWISMDSKANFFERDVSQYSRAETTDFTLLEDF